MTNFCTLFDSNYLTRGIALYESLKKNCKSFHLYVVAFNDDCYHYLSSANFTHLTVISLAEFEDPELLKVKPTRTAAEYCWTCTPSIVLYCIRQFHLPSCTYLDADMIFYGDPMVLLAEARDKSVIITEHRYSREYIQPNAGIYCVQFVFFKNDEKGLNALNWWRDRCIEWCYAYYEDGKFGDQKYLDDWPARFEGVHVLQHPGGGIAPWNVQQYEAADTAGKLLCEKNAGNSFPVIFFHFHGLKFHTDAVVSLSNSLYELEDWVKKTFYFPYVIQLERLENELKKNGVRFNATGARSKAPGKGKVFRQFVWERLLLFRLGNISLFRLNLFKFRKHYHFHSIESLKERNYGPTPRS
jgi:hypothetical protein